MLGWWAEISGQLEEAIKHYAQAATNAIAAGDAEEQAIWEAMLIEPYCYLNRLEDAKAAFEQSVRLTEALDIQDTQKSMRARANISLNGGFLSLWLGDIAEAVERFGQAVHFTEQQGPDRLLPICLSRLGYAEARAGNFTTGEEHAIKGLELSQQKHALWLEAITQHTLGKVYSLAGNVDKARKHLIEGRRLYTIFGTAHLLQETENDLAGLDS